MDLLNLTKTLIQFKSITPKSAGSIEYIHAFLNDLGFVSFLLPFEDTLNLYAEKKGNGPNLCFAGHLDVVPTRSETLWKADPFEGRIIDGKIYGRGTVDMKGAIAAWLHALARFLKAYPSHNQSFSLLLTSDEEGPAKNGTIKVIEWLQQNNKKIDFCLVGEPTNELMVGDTIKNGRRGSVNGEITIFGKEGHVAYPDKAQNPVDTLPQLLDGIHSYSWDDGYQSQSVCFPPSKLVITQITCENETRNLIPGYAKVLFNIRFNPHQNVQTIKEKLEHLIKQHIYDFKLSLSLSGQPFYNTNTVLENCLIESIKKVRGRTPILSTTGGTSDARFIKDICPVIEFGLINQTAHQVDEHIAITELETLEKIYFDFLHTFNA